MSRDYGEISMETDLNKLSEDLEQAYWDFDAAHNGYGKHKNMPLSDRDAFKSIVAALIQKYVKND